MSKTKFFFKSTVDRYMCINTPVLVYAQIDDTTKEIELLNISTDVESGFLDDLSDRKHQELMNEAALAVEENTYTPLVEG